MNQIENWQYRSQVVTTASDVERVLELRERCFGRKFDYDFFEKNADHLVVEDLKTGKFVGAYRLGSSKDIRTFESQSYFEMSSWLSRQGHVVELGWACVHEDYRQGGVMGMLWAALRAYFLSRAVDIVFGPTGIANLSKCEIRALMKFLKENHHDLRTSEIHALRTPHISQADSLSAPITFDKRKLPKMLRAYLAIGARVLLDPVFDPESNCYDLLTVFEPNHRSHLPSPQAALSFTGEFENSFATAIQIVV